MSIRVLQSMLGRVAKGARIPKPRFFSTVNVNQGTRIGYECLGHTDLNTERAIITKSLARGCKTIVTKSREGFVQTYELLCDLTEDEECQPSSLFLGHICSTSASADAWAGELTDINGTLNVINRNLNFISIPLSATNPWQLDAISTQLKHLHDTAKCALIKGNVCKVGVDLNAAFLSTLTAADVVRLVSNILQPLADTGLLQALSVSTNAFTFEHTKTIYKWTASQNSIDKDTILVIATDTLRSHAQRPGLLLSDYSHAAQHHMAPVETPYKPSGEPPFADSKMSVEVSKQSPEVQAMVKRVTAATENMNMHINKCFHTENVFLSKISPEDTANIPLNEVLLARMLRASHSQIKYPEEWKYFLRTEIEPNLADGLKTLKGQGTTQDDFASLYRPMAKNMLSSFGHLLQEIALLRSLEVLEIVREYQAETGGAQEAGGGGGGVGETSGGTAHGLSSSLPEALAKLTIDWTGAHFATIPQTKVDIEKWGDASSASVVSNAEALDKLYNKVRSKLEEE